LVPSSGYLKVVWLKIFGPVFLDFRLKIDPGTPHDRRGSPGTSICTKNQPRRPILRQFRGTRNEGSLAEFFVRRHLTLELVCGADFSWKLMCGAGPGGLGGSRGPVTAENAGKPGRKSPARLPSGTQSKLLPDRFRVGSGSIPNWLRVGAGSAAGRSNPPKSPGPAPHVNLH